MAKRPTINTLTNTASPTYLTQLNQNFTNIQAQFDNTLSLDGSLPNAMNADLDLNDFDLINAGTVNADNLVVAGTNLNSVVAQAATSATNAATSASAAAASAATASQYTPAYFTDVAELLADTRSWPTGQILNTREEGFAYEVVTSGQHVTTAGGVKLIVLPGDTGYNVKAFGAKGNGTTNDTAAIQAAIDYATSIGFPVVIPTGTYSITTLTLPVQLGGVAIRGEGSFTSSAAAAAGTYWGASLVSTATSGNVISANGGASYQNRGIEISGLNITGVTSGYIIHIEGSPDNNVLDRLGVYNLSPTGGSGIYLRSAWVNTRISNVNCSASAKGSGTYGLFVENAIAAGGFIAIASRWGGFETGVYFGANTYQAKFLVCGMESNKYGFRGAGGAFNGVSLDTCHYEFNTDHAVWIEKVNKAEIKNCTFYRNSESASGTAADIYVTGAVGFENYNVKISDNRSFGLSSNVTFIYIGDTAYNSGVIQNNQAIKFSGATVTTGLNLFSSAGRDHWSVTDNLFQSLDTPYVGATETKMFNEALTATQSIRFNATAIASTDPNTLDDYEEGNWTPVLNGDGAAPSGQAYVRQVGRYQKVGNRVYFTFDVELSTEGTVNGSAAVTGLPFTISASPGASAGYISDFSNLNLSVVDIVLRPNPNSTIYYLRHATAAATGTTITGGATLFTNTTRIIGGGSYIVA